MDFSETLILCLAFAGLIWTITEATIMDKLGIRPFLEQWQFMREMLSCGGCTGVHVGWTYGLLCAVLAMNNSLWFYVMTLPFASSAIGLFYQKAMIWLLNEVDKQEKK